MTGNGENEDCDGGDGCDNEDEDDEEEEGGGNEVENKLQDEPSRENVDSLLTWLTTG